MLGLCAGLWFIVLALFGTIAYVGGGVFLAFRSKSSLPPKYGGSIAGVLRLHPHWKQWAEVVGLCKDGLKFSREKGGFSMGAGSRTTGYVVYAPIHGLAAASRTEAQHRGGNAALHKGKSKSKSKSKSKTKSKGTIKGIGKRSSEQVFAPNTQNDDGQDGGASKGGHGATLLAAGVNVAEPNGFGGRLTEQRDDSGVHASQAKIKIITEAM